MTNTSMAISNYIGTKLKYLIHILKKWWVSFNKIPKKIHLKISLKTIHNLDQSTTKDSLLLQSKGTLTEKALSQ